MATDAREDGRDDNDDAKIIPYVRGFRTLIDPTVPFGRPRKRSPQSSPERPSRDRPKNVISKLH